MKPSRKASVASKKPASQRTAADGLFQRVAGILDEARTQTVRSVNTWMVTAYWLIGREIVEVEQGGKERAEYGARLLEGLSGRLTKRFGKGFSVQSLGNFRNFFLTFRERRPAIPSTLWRELEESRIPSPVGRELESSRSRVSKSSPMGRESQSSQQLSLNTKGPIGENVSVFEEGFHPNLGWSHYRALMRVEKPEARQFYEEEAIRGHWNKRQLERQISSLYYERLLMSRDKRGMLEKQRKPEAGVHPLDIIKDPYVLEFLNLPESHQLSETELETALIGHLQSFLLELGHGFAFIGRQQRLTLDGDHFYADLVFYHVRLKCYIVIDLKTGRLDHADLGQMQLYVNYYDREVKLPDENPTIGIVLCKRKKDAVVELTLPKDANIHAKQYKLYLPSKEELKRKLLE